MNTIFFLTLLGTLAFFQNMVFTAVSRSRNSGNPQHHRKWAYLSNSIWFVTNALIMKQVWVSIETGSWQTLVIALVIYTLATTEGSVLMMKHMLKTESGDTRVGANKNKSSVT